MAIGEPNTIKYLPFLGLKAEKMVWLKNFEDRNGEKNHVPIAFAPQFGCMSYTCNVLNPPIHGIKRKNKFLF
jgi:hypothetical protein